jgi:hypothetical protein
VPTYDSLAPHSTPGTVPCIGPLFWLSLLPGVYLSFQMAVAGNSNRCPSGLAYCPCRSTGSNNGSDRLWNTTLPSPGRYLPTLSLLVWTGGSPTGTPRPNPQVRTYPAVLFWRVARPPALPPGCPAATSCETRTRVAQTLS